MKHERLVAGVVTFAFGAAVFIIPASGSNCPSEQCVGISEDFSPESDHTHTETEEPTPWGGQSISGASGNNNNNAWIG